MHVRERDKHQQHLERGKLEKKHGGNRFRHPIEPFGGNSIDCVVLRVFSLRQRKYMESMDNGRFPE